MNILNESNQTLFDPQPNQNNNFTPITNSIHTSMDPHHHIIYSLHLKTLQIFENLPLVVIVKCDITCTGQGFQYFGVRVPYAGTLLCNGRELKHKEEANLITH